jgi:hypothetical protein
MYFWSYQVSITNDEIVVMFDVGEGFVLKSCHACRIGFIYDQSYSVSTGIDCGLDSWGFDSQKV